jgi:Phage integrase, N-terminal SAM-like domain
MRRSDGTAPPHHASSTTRCHAPKARRRHGDVGFTIARMQASTCWLVVSLPVTSTGREEDAGLRRGEGRPVYAVIYEGIDPITGPERRRWHAVGSDRAQAARSTVLLAEAARARDVTPGLTLARYLLQTWLPRRRLSLRPSTWDGYRRNIELHVVSSIGRTPLRRLRGPHLDALYPELLTNGRADGAGGLDSKSVLEIHVILHKALRDACRQGLVERNAADDAEPPKRRGHDHGA